MTKFDMADAAETIAIQNNYLNDLTLVFLDAFQFRAADQELFQGCEGVLNAILDCSIKIRQLAEPLYEQLYEELQQERKVPKN